MGKESANPAIWDEKPGSHFSTAMHDEPMAYNIPQKYATMTVS